MRNNRKKTGYYEPVEMSKEEIKNFEKCKKVWWDVYLSRGEGFLTNSQFEAEVISRLERMEKRLRKLESQKLKAKA